MKHVVLFSGGVASSYMAFLLKKDENIENKDIVLLHTPTLSECEDSEKFRLKVARYLKLPMTVWGRVEVKHRDDADLMQKLQDPVFVDNMPLPETSDYIEDSYEIDFEGLEEFDKAKQEHKECTTTNDIKRNIDMTLKTMKDYGYSSELHGVNRNVRMMSLTEKEAREL